MCALRARYSIVRDCGLEFDVTDVLQNSVATTRFWFDSGRLKSGRSSLA
jgi:hypothetical protein